MVRVHFSALSSEQVCSSLSRIKKNGAKDEGRTDNQLRVRAQALQPERPRGGNRESEKKDYVDVESQKAWDAERASGDGVRTPNFS